MKYLKSILIAMICLAAAMPAAAKDDPDSRHVRLTMMNGDTITGWIRHDLTTGLKNMFSKSGSIIQYVNISDAPDKGKSQRYSATEVKELRYLEPTESDPEGAVMVSERINSPLPFKPDKNIRGFAWELNRTECGSILQWNVWESTGGQNSVSRLVPAVGVMLKGARSAYVMYTNGREAMFMLKHYLKKKAPEFNKFLEEHLDKPHSREMKENPSIILELYAEYLKTNPPIDDPDREKDRLADEKAFAKKLAKKKKDTTETEED